jgi:hypothetical protein
MFFWRSLLHHSMHIRTSKITRRKNLCPSCRRAVMSKTRNQYRLCVVRVSKIQLAVFTCARSLPSRFPKRREKCLSERLRIFLQPLRSLCRVTSHLVSHKNIWTDVFSVSCCCVHVSKTVGKRSNVLSVSRKLIWILVHGRHPCLCPCEDSGI